MGETQRVYDAPIGGETIDRRVGFLTIPARTNLQEAIINHLIKLHPGYKGDDLS